MFSAQLEEALDWVLSLARKYGLFLTKAHQTFSQVSARLQGALQNTVSIAFKLGWSNAEWAAKRFGRFDDAAIRPEVEYSRAVERTHPMFWGLAGTFGRWTKALEELHQHEAFAKIGSHTTKLQTRFVPHLRVSREGLADLIQRCVQHLMTPADEVIEPPDGLVEGARGPIWQPREILG